MLCRLLARLKVRLGMILAEKSLSLYQRDHNHYKEQRDRHFRSESSSRPKELLLATSNR